MQRPCQLARPPSPLRRRPTKKAAATGEESRRRRRKPRRRRPQSGRPASYAAHAGRGARGDPVRSQLDRPLHRAGQRRIQRPRGRRGEGVPEGQRLQETGVLNRRSAPRSPPPRSAGSDASAGAWSRTARPARSSACRRSSRPQTSRSAAARAGSRRRARSRSRRSAPQPGATLATVFEQQKKEPANRKLELQRAAQRLLRA